MFTIEKSPRYFSSSFQLYLGNLCVLLVLKYGVYEGTLRHWILKCADIKFSSCFEVSSAVPFRFLSVFLTVFFLDKIPAPSANRTLHS